MTPSSSCLSLKVLAAARLLVARKRDIPVRRAQSLLLRSQDTLLCKIGGFPPHHRGEGRTAEVFDSDGCHLDVVAEIFVSTVRETEHAIGRGVGVNWRIRPWWSYRVVCMNNIHTIL